MAGSFRLPGGLNYNGPEPEQEDPEEQNDLYNDGMDDPEAQTDDDTSDDGTEGSSDEDEGGSNDDDGTEAEESKQEKERKERKTKRKLQKFSDKIKERFIPLPTSEEKEALKEGEKNKNLKEKAREAKNKLKEALANFWQTKVYPNLGWICAGLFIVFVLFIIICVVISYETEKYPEDGTSASVFGVKGDKFYGVRAVYADEDKATIELFDEYYSTLSDSFTEVKKITSMPNPNDSNNPYSVEISVTTMLLPESYDFSNLNEEELQTDYAEVYGVVKQIADKVYDVDKEDGATAPTNLMETLKAIKYFGLNEQLNSDIKTLVSDYVKAHYTFTVEDGATITKTEIDAKIDTIINTVFESNKYKNRTEKLFVKDFVFASEDEYMKGAEAKDYKAFIFMPKATVNLTSISFEVKDADFTNFNLELLCNGQTINLTKKINTIHGEGTEAYLYNSANNLNLAIEEYNYTSLPAEEMAIVGLAGNSAYANLLKVDEETNVSIWNYEQSALMAKIENGAGTPFLFSEEETKYS